MKHVQPLLLDALYINIGGGLVLLDYLLKHLKKAEVNYVLLKDSRCPMLEAEDFAKTVYVIPATIKRRRRYYLEHQDEYSKVLCFGNVPPPIRMKCAVYTYFQNVNLLDIPKLYGVKEKLKIWFKQRYIAFYGKNTDSWIVQTSHTETLVKKYLGASKILVYPFFNIPQSISELANDKVNRNDYLLIGNYYFGTKGHDVLLDAWERLSQLGVNCKLHLTISFDNIEVCHRIQKMIKDGVNIVNHGSIPFSEVVNLYKVSKATIYPSINESLGLGIIESLYAGCDVIASDLPFTYAVCNPSETFDPKNVDEVVDAVLRYENSVKIKSSLVIENKIKELVGLLSEDVY